MLNSSSNNKNLYEVKYVDINDMNHEEKTAFMYGSSEDDLSEEFIGANLNHEQFNVINEPTVLIKSIKLVIDKNLA